MFKKGFKALKSLGRKSKKKDKGDGDDVSQKSQVDDTVGQGKTPRAALQARSKSNISQSNVASGRLNKSPRPVDEGASAYPPSASNTPKIPPTHGRMSASSSQSSLLKQTSNKPPISRETTAEDSVLAMMQNMKAAKEAEKGKNDQPDLAHSDSSDSEDDDSSSSESELTVKKKLREKQEKEERKHKGLSVSSSSDSEGSSWGDTSDVLPEVTQKGSAALESANTGPKNVVSAQSPAASANKQQAESDSDDSWGDTDDDEKQDSEQFKGAAKVPQTAAGVLSEPTSQLSDGEEVDVGIKPLAMSSPTADPMPSPTASPMPSPTASPMSSPTTNPMPSPTTDPMPSPTTGIVTKPEGNISSNGVDPGKSKAPEIDIMSDSESLWSDEDLNDTRQSHTEEAIGGQLTHGQDAVVEQQKVISADTIAQVSVTAGSGINIKPPDTSETHTKPAAVTRQQSEESLWSDEDDDEIELLASPRKDVDKDNTVAVQSNGGISEIVTPVTSEQLQSAPAPALAPAPDIVKAGGIKEESGSPPTITYSSMNEGGDVPSAHGSTAADGNFTSNSNQSKTSFANDEITADLTSKLAAAGKMQASLEDENDDLRRKLSKVCHEREKLGVTVQRLESESLELRSRTEKYDDVTKKLKVIMDENQRLADEQVDSQRLSEEVTRLNDEMEKTKSQQSEKDGDLNKENFELRQSIEDWQSKYSQLEQSSQQHQQACRELEVEIKELNENIQLLESQKSAQETDNSKTIKELELLKGELKDKSGFEILKRDLESMTREHSDRVAAMAREHSDKVEKLNKELSLNKNAHEQGLQQVSLAHKQEIDQLNAANERKSQLADTRVGSLNQQILSLQSDNKDFQSRLSTLRTEQSAKSKSLIPQSEYLEQQRENDLLQQKIKELEKRLRKQELQHPLDRIEAEQTVTVSRNVQMSVSSSDEDDSHHERYNGHSPMAINGVQQKEMQRREEKIRLLNSENAELQKSVAKLQSETRTLSAQLQAAQDGSDDLRVQTDKLREKLNIRDQEVTMELNKKLESELTADAQHGKLRQQIVLFENQILRLKETNFQLEHKLRSMSAELEVKENLLRSQSDGAAHMADASLLDSELVQVRTELAQVRSSLEAERATFMTALDEKDQELSAENADKESAKAALDEVTKSLMYLQEDVANNFTPVSLHQEALNKASVHEDKVRRDLLAVRGSLDSYSKDAIEAKNVCSMQLILINEKDRELRDKDRDLKNLRRELDAKIEALSNMNSQLQQSGKDRDRDQDRLREMMSMSRNLDPRTETINYKTMYDEMRVDREREKATTDQLIERLKWEISTVEERLEKAKDELKDKVKLETNYLLAQGEAERFKQEATELVRKVTRLEEKVELQQRDSDHLKESRHEVGANNQTLKDENSRLRENNTELRLQMENTHRELSSYGVTKEEMETALATAKLTTDVNDMSRQENDTEIHLERKHKMVLYKQAKALKTEVNEKNIRLQELEKLTEKLRNKVTKLKIENTALQARMVDRGATEARMSWDAATGLTHSDLFQQEVKQLQSQLNSTTTDMQVQARKAKARKYDLNYHQVKAEHLEKQNQQLSSKLNDSLRMIEAAERTATDLRLHITELNNRLQQMEQLENSSDMTVQDLRQSYDEKSKYLQKENNDLERELRQLKRRLSVAEVELAATERMTSPVNGRLPRSRSSSPPRYIKSGSSRSGGSPTTEYEKDRRALTRAAWAVLDDHGLGPPAEQRVFENLDRIWRRNASRPARRV